MTHDEERLHRLRMAEIEAEIEVIKARGRVLQSALHAKELLANWRPGLYLEYGGDIEAWEAAHGSHRGATDDT